MNSLGFSKLILLSVPVVLSWGLVGPAQAEAQESCPARARDHVPWEYIGMFEAVCDVGSTEEYQARTGTFNQILLNYFRRIIHLENCGYLIRDVRNPRFSSYANLETTPERSAGGLNLQSIGRNPRFVVDEAYAMGARACEFDLAKKLTGSKRVRLKWHVNIGDLTLATDIVEFGAVD